MMMMMALCSVVLVPMLSLSTFWKCVLVGVWIVYQMVERKNQFVKPSRSLAIVVTGADSGFGKEISIRLANRGFTVFAGMLQKKRNNNKNIIPLQMDVTSSSEVRDAFDRVRAWCDEEKRHVFAYTITITNHSPIGIKLLTRYWHIQDANNKVQEVSGEGVVGQQPRLGKDQSFQYSSGAILETPAGIMEGHYDFVNDNGDIFKAPIPAFTLANPAILH